jgi:hypothetical protein
MKYIMLGIAFIILGIYAIIFMAIKFIIDIIKDHIK